MTQTTDKEIQLLKLIAEGIIMLADAVQNQNVLIEECMTKPEEAAPNRFLVGICGAVETMEL